jgi:hypothetical protein
VEAVREEMVDPEVQVLLQLGLAAIQQVAVAVVVAATQTVAVAVVGVLVCMGAAQQL